MRTVKQEQVLGRVYKWSKKWAGERYIFAISSLKPVIEYSIAIEVALWNDDEEGNEVGDGEVVMELER